jgi:hypothetical protein
MDVGSPHRGAVACKVISEDPNTRRFVYESPSYRFTCDARVTDDALRNLSVMFEVTRKYAQDLPLSLGGGRQREGKLDILGWFSEGLAEYMAITPYNRGYFRPDIHGNTVKTYVTANGEGGLGGRALGTNIAAPKLKEFFLMPKPNFPDPTRIPTTAWPCC